MLVEKIDSLIADATKKQEKVRLQVLRMIKNEFIKFVTSGKDKVIMPNIENDIILKMISRSQDSQKEFALGGRQDLVTQEKEQCDILLQFAPKMATIEEIEAETRLVIENLIKVNGEPPKMKNMKEILSIVKDKCPNADGKSVAKILKEYIK